ncbi:MAG: hypothetical protein ABIK09_10415 [Pseudomonadota bacterium]
MRRQIILTALLIAGVLAGCAPEGTPQALILQFNSVVGAENSCKLQVASGGGAQATRSVGTLDLLFASNYMFFPAIANALLEAGETSGFGVEQGSLDPNGVTLTGARVWFEIEGLRGQWDGSETVLPDEIFSPTSGHISPGKFGTVAVELLSAAVVNILDADIAFDNIYSGGYLIAHVVIEGRTLDGEKVRSNEFVYPINVCRGCLLYWPFKDLSKCCEGLTSDDTVCYPGQDEAVPCDLGCTLVEYDPRAEAKASMILKETDTLSSTGGGGTGGDVMEADVAEEDTL